LQYFYAGGALEQLGQALVGRVEALDDADNGGRMAPLV